MMALTLGLLMTASVASLRAATAPRGGGTPREFKCGEYELRGKLLRPDGGVYELALYPGSKGEYRVRLFGLSGEKPRDFVGSQVELKAVVERVFRGAEGSFHQAKIVGLADAQKVVDEPAVLVSEHDCKSR